MRVAHGSTSLTETGRVRLREHYDRLPLLLVLALYVVVVLRCAWISDDAYITFRTVDNFTAGYGLTWNPGERVQAFTHPLWALVLCATYALTQEIHVTTIALSAGLSALAVLLFEVLLNATSLFSHGNVQLPGWLDRVLRLVVVTPEMHRVHHSVNPRETNSNFGFDLPWWDYLLGTYRPQPAEGHEGMTIGLEQFRDERIADRLHWMLALPFTGTEGDYPVNRRGEGQGPPRPSTTAPAANSGHALGV